MAGYYIYQVPELSGFASWLILFCGSPKQLIFKIIDQISYLQQYIHIQRLRRANPPRQDLA